MRIRAKLRGAGQDRGLWLVLLFVLLSVLIPTGCVLWFTNQTINIQRETAHARLIEAYRSQLTLVRDKLDAYWEQRQRDLDLLAESGTPPQVFAGAVRRGAADAVICLNSNGTVAYPSARLRIMADPAERRQDWMQAAALEYQADFPVAAAAYGRIAAKDNNVSMKARALQAQVRCLVRAGQKPAAIRLIEEHFTHSRAVAGLDLQGRIISADERLLMLQLMKPSAPGYLDAARRLRDILADYSEPLLPSPQRLFLISGLRDLRLGPEFDNTPTYNAERLAVDFLAADRALSHDPVLEASTLPDVWKLASTNGRLVALFRSRTLVGVMSRFLNEQSPSPVATFSVLPPGARIQTGNETIPAGQMSRGWRVALSLQEGNVFQNVLRRQTLAYVLSASLAIVILAIAGTLVGRALGRQMRLARMKTDLVAAVSHELKTPLASMQVLTDALLDEDRFDRQKTREYLMLIARENGRLGRLIDNFLTFSRMERGRHKFEFAETNVADIVHTAVDVAAQRFNTAQCNLAVDISPGLPPLRADSDALVTVLLNLLDNAYKFTPQGKHIVLRAFGKDGRVSFGVSDNGIGITAREQKRIFRSFYQVDRRLSRQAGGCGLGLSIVQFIVQAHSGNIQVESRPGAGSTFMVSLPSSTSREGAPV